MAQVTKNGAEDHCPSVCSLTARRFGLGCALQTCYVTSFTGTDVDLSGSRKGFGCGGTEGPER